MKTFQDLDNLLSRIDGKGYKAYKEIAGVYRFPGFTVMIDHVQGDPYAAPSRVRVRVSRVDGGFSADMTSAPVRKAALGDFLTRMFHLSATAVAKGGRGIGKGGQILIGRPAQEILDRTAMLVTDADVEARITMGLPARGRGVSGKDAREMFFQELPEIVKRSLFLPALSAEALENHLDTAEDTDALRSQLAANNLAAFVGNGALLPRASGIDPAPLPADQAVLFEAPRDMTVVLDAPHRGRVAGMGIPRGVTLVVGGGYHGKSTLLNALEVGIYNHIPGDGRECVVTSAGAVKIRAADGRQITGTDISPFIGALPMGRDTRAFSTANASGSTSQAANIVEAVEAGADMLLVDEDTSATNFMIRDVRMQRLVAKHQEPITPFVDKVRQLYADYGVSTVLVMGGSGDYFSVADHVIQMAAYRPLNVTAAAKEAAAWGADRRQQEGGEVFGPIGCRMPLPDGISPRLPSGKMKITAPRLREMRIGNRTVDLSDVAQLVEPAQTLAMGFAVHYAVRYMDGRCSMKDVAARVLSDIAMDGLDVIVPYIRGDLACFRALELIAAINRMRLLRVRQAGKEAEQKRGVQT